jgi:hypothetical protein
MIALGPWLWAQSAHTGRRNSVNGMMIGPIGLGQVDAEPLWDQFVASPRAGGGATRMTTA